MEEYNPYNDLSYIKQIIQESRQSFIFTNSAIVWSIIIFIMMLLTYYSVIIREHAFMTPAWTVAMIIGWAYSFYEGRKKRKINKNKTLVDRLISSVWVAVGIAASIIGFGGMFHLYQNSLLISPMISIVVGVGYYITGSIHKTNWYRNLSFGWWGSAIVMFLIMNVNQLLIMAAVMILFQLIPNIIIRKQEKAGN